MPFATGDTGHLAEHNRLAGVGLLQSTYYNPGTSVTASTTSIYSVGGWVDVDATNMSVTFTAPASGSVLVKANCVGDCSSGTNYHMWALRDAGGTMADTGCSMMRNTSSLQMNKTWKITGLTPGNSYTYKLAFAVSAAATANLYFGGGNTNPNGPGILEVWGA